MQADLRLCWSHIPHCWKSHALAQNFIIVVPSDPLPDIQIATSTSNTFKVTWTPYSCETKDVSYVEFYIVSYCKVSESKNCTQESCK